MTALYPAVAPAAGLPAIAGQGKKASAKDHNRYDCSSKSDAAFPHRDFFGRRGERNHSCTSQKSGGSGVTLHTIVSAGPVGASAGSVAANPGETSR